MGLLLYKSDEMFSSTELIRKSKMVFDKVSNKEIEKAIILRDGKPSFLLMDFSKYEKIMAEFEELKKGLKRKPRDKNSKTPEIKKLKQNNQQEIDSQKNKIQPQEEEIIVIQKNEQLDQVVEEVDDEISEQEELTKAFKSIENMSFDEEMKSKAKEKIKAKILEARKQRAKILEKEKSEITQEEQKEKEIEKSIREEKIKKERELKEFWD